MNPRDERTKNILEKEIQKFYVVRTYARFCAECGRETRAFPICTRCMKRHQVADLKRRTALIRN